MTRSRSNQRKKEAGHKVKCFNSRSSPSYHNSRELYRKEKMIGKPYYRHHAKRTALKAQLTKDLGLPLNTKFIFRYSVKDHPELEGRERISITHGTVVVINKRDLSIVLAVQCIPFKDMTPELRAQYDHSISTTFQHARARNRCKIHCSLQKCEESDGEPLDGWMGCAGWRGGCDKDKSLGPYSFNAFTSANPARIQTDRERMIEFHQIRDFWAGRFSILSLFVFKTNLALAFEAAVPGFHDLLWQGTQNGLVFASNLVVTCLGFHNHPHTDKDHTRYGFGMWGLIVMKSGMPYDKVKGTTVGKRDGVKLGEVRGAKFRVDEFGVEIALDGCNGVYDVLWDTTINHYTTSSVAYNGKGEVIPHQKGEVTLYGSSCQISQSLVHRIKLLGDKKIGISEVEWKKYCKERVKSYEEMASYKEKKIVEKKELKMKENEKKKEAKKAKK